MKGWVHSLVIVSAITVSVMIFNSFGCTCYRECEGYREVTLQDIVKQHPYAKVETLEDGRTRVRWNVLNKSAIRNADFATFLFIADKDGKCLDVCFSEFVGIPY